MNSPIGLNAPHFLLLLGLVVILFVKKSFSAEALVPATVGPFSIGIRSMQELRFLETVPQRYDFSCGSAALATLLTYHYDRPRSEAEIFEKMWNRGDKEKIRENGFSMLDMKHYLESQGLSGDGFKIPIERIGNLGIAGIILLTNLDAPHFVVVIGQANGQLLISDPARGIWNVPLEEAERLWNEVFFMVRDRASLAKSNFNDPDIWKRHRWSPLNEAETVQWIVPLSEELPMAAEFNAN